MLTKKVINSLKTYPAKYKKGLSEIELNEFLKEHKLATVFGFAVGVE